MKKKKIQFKCILGFLKNNKDSLVFTYNIVGVQKEKCRSTGRNCLKKGKKNPI